MNKNYELLWVCIATELGILPVIDFTCGLAGDWLKLSQSPAEQEN